MNLIIIIDSVDLLEEKESHGDNSILFVFFHQNISEFCALKAVFASVWCSDKFRALFATK